VRKFQDTGRESESNYKEKEKRKELTLHQFTDTNVSKKTKFILVLVCCYFSQILILLFRLFKKM
jgi:hypothetical protein